MDNNQNAAGTEPAMVVTDCCGRLLPETLTLTGDVHFPDRCPACVWLTARECGSHLVGTDTCPMHGSHVTCVDEQCPGRDWTYVQGQFAAGLKRDGQA